LSIDAFFTRQQMSLNGLQSSSKYDKESNELKNQMQNISDEKNKLERSLIEENAQKERVLEILQESESINFHFC
jgi:hypothetical protein